MLSDAAKDWLWTGSAFILICAFGAGAYFAIGSIYTGREAVELIEALSRSGLYLGSATATASATTLALMLTLVGMMRRSDEDFNVRNYRNIAHVAKLATVGLIISLILLLTMVFPVGEFDEISPYWYVWLYDALFILTVLSVAVLAATVMMLYQTVHRVIAQLTPTDEV